MARGVLAVVLAVLVTACSFAPSTARPPIGASASFGAPVETESETDVDSPTPCPTSPSPQTPHPERPSPPAPTPSPSATVSRPSPVPTNPPVPCVGSVRRAVSGPAAPLVYSGSRTRRVIALTIDDGASDDAVLAILALLERRRVNATWFPIGAYVERSPGVWRAVSDAGFPIGNHTYDHRNLGCMTYADALGDIERGERTVRRVIGRPLLPIVRPPGGGVDRLVEQAAYAAGDRYVVKWDLTDGDTARDGDDVAQLIADGERGGAGSILLVHANRPYTQQALPAIIDFYRSKGFTFVTLGQLLGVDGPVPYPPA